MTPADRSITFAYTPDPDDAFHYCALQTGQVPHPGLACEFFTGHIRDLNESCLRNAYDVCAISSVFYPEIDDQYVILASGASVGRGYGPVLACRAGESFTSLAGCRVGVPGTTTTGYFLLRYFYADFVPVPLPFDRVGDALLTGDIDAGVMIHEELLNFGERRLAKICCLGARWFEHAGLPLPVGLVVARRALGLPRLARIESLLHASMAWALAHRAEALAFASRFGRGPLSRVREDFVDKFANTDTLLMPEDVRLGLSTLYTKALKRGLIDHLPALDVIDPPPPHARDAA
ncbi:MAG: MqnA/MqnD/SBP family protein [Gammaproteobacteria bacterium]